MYVAAISEVKVTVMVFGDEGSYFDTYTVFIRNIYHLHKQNHKEVDFLEIKMVLVFEPFRWQKL